MATFDEFYQSLPEDSIKRGEFFEKAFVPWFLKTDPEWSSKVKQIWLWKEYPQRWGKDCGIDLIYEDQQGNHWAIQSKCVSPEREISKAEIDSFLSESNDSRIYGRLLIASTDGIGKNAQQVIERQEKQVVCFLREHFRQSEVEFPSSPHDLSTGHRKDKRRPRPHQQEAIQNVVGGLQTQDRGQLLMACGTGKTLTSLWIKEEMNAGRTLVLLPSLSLLSQTLREWTAASRTEFNWICVCSDKSVAKQDKTVDDWIENVNELGVPVTSDPSEIRSFLLENEQGIVFSTYQSSPLVVEAQKSSGIPAFDIAFADEAHRCAGKVSSAFGCILDEQKIKAEKRLFMTATPRVLSNRIKSRAETEDIEVASMDDEGLFGKVLHRLNFSEAINNDLLTDYRVVVIGVDDPQVESKIINRPLSSTGNGVEIDFETLANHISIHKSVQDYNLQRVITFHGRVNGAKKFSENHPKIVEWLSRGSGSPARISADYVSGDMTSLERNRRIGRLRNLKENEFGLLSNARCLSEGVDVPTLDGIAFVDPRSSQVDIIQAVGRAIRKSDSKSYGYIILPVYLGDTISLDTAILESRFKDVWEIILALRSQDDSLAETLDRLRIELGRKESANAREEDLEKIIFDLPRGIPSEIADSLRTILICNTTRKWHEMYGLLLRYVDSNGHANPPTRDTVIGAWVNKQRTQYSRKELSPDRISMLEGVPGWVWNARESEWRARYNELSCHLENTSSGKYSSMNTKLENWTVTQKLLYKEGKQSEERIRLLEALEGWVWDSKESSWRAKFNELVEYTNEHGEARPGSKHPELGKWINKQRMSYKAGTLDRKRVELLESLQGWVWDELEFQWEKNYQEFINSFANTVDAKSSTVSSLDKWAIKQRSLYSKGELSQDRATKLELINGWAWDSKESSWRAKFNELVEYTNEHGEARPGSKHPELGKWINKQRMSYKAGTLDRKRVELLESLQGWVWDELEFQWEKNYQELVDYAKAHGEACPSQRYPGLGVWVSTQRRNFNLGNLSETRIKLLEKLTGWTWKAR